MRSKNFKEKKYVEPETPDSRINSNNAEQYYKTQHCFSVSSNATMMPSSGHKVQRLPHKSLVGPRFEAKSRSKSHSQIEKKKGEKK